MTEILNLPTLNTALNTADGIAQPAGARRAGVELVIAAAIFAAAVFGASSVFASPQPGAPVTEIETQAGLAIAHQGNQALRAIREDARQLGSMPVFEPAVAASDMVVAETVDGRFPQGRP